MPALVSSTISPWVLSILFWLVSKILNANLSLSAGDTVKVSAYQDSGSTRSMLGGTTFSEFSGFKIIE